MIRLASSQKQVVEPSENPEVNKSFDETLERSDYDPGAGNGIAVEEALELREQVGKRLETENAEERADRRQR